MPKSEVTIVGIKRIESGTRYTLSNKKEVETRLHTTVGWSSKRGDAPIIIIGETRYKNEIPRVQMMAWIKTDLKKLAGS